MSNNEVSLLNIYSQKEEHGESFIVGNARGLLELKYAIENAIKYNVAETNAFVLSDGEGFEIKIVCLPEDKKEIGDKLCVPYRQMDDRVEWGGTVDLTMLLSLVKRKS